jgi:hypothetical protein
MEAKVVHLDRLLEMIQKKTKQPPDWAGFGEMARQMLEDHGTDVSQKYLYDNIFRSKASAQKEGLATLSLSLRKLDQLAIFIGYSSYREFTEKIDKPIDPVLLSCIGNYYSYVRRNDDLGVILRSPVQIREEDGRISFELKGPTWVYKGKIKLANLCLFILMQSSGGKEIHHVYKIGVRKKPDVLQGIFSGVSTSFDPIGGRAVLIRSEEKYDTMSNAALEVDSLITSPDTILRRIGSYFSERTGNNILINNSGMLTFGPDDLLNSSSKP